MKIVDVELTLFNWDDIPPTRYHAGSVNSGGQSNLGLLTLRTDQVIEGHAFLGGATNPAETDAGALIRFLKPVLMGKDPLARTDLHAALRAKQRTAGLRTVGACDTALWDIAAKAAGLPLEVLNYSVTVDTANGRTRAAPVTLDRVAVGTIVERSVPALIAQPGQLRTNLLGMSFLNRLESWEVRGDKLVMRGYR